MRTSRLSGVVTAGVGLLIASVLAAPSSAAAVGPGTSVPVPDTSPDWATPTNALGVAPASKVVKFRVGLHQRDAVDAETFVKQVSDPHSPLYGHYLTPAQYHARYSPDGSTVASVGNYLTSSGLRVTGVAAGNQWLDVQGTVAQIDKALGTTMKTYRTPKGQRTAPATDVTLPAAVAGSVSTVAGLADAGGLRRPDTAHVVTSVAAKSASPAAAKPSPSQCSDYWGEYQQTLPAAYGTTSFNTYICGYTPAQLRKAYGTEALVGHGVTGKGVTVAILDAYASPTMLSDANAYSAAVGERAFADGQYTEKVFGPFDEQDLCQGETGWNEEQSLDVEAVHGMAPAAHVLYVGAQNCDEGLDEALQWVVDTHAAEIVSNSYGWLGEDVPADEIALEHGIFLQAAAEGIGLYFSSGDSGDEVVNGYDPQPDYASSDPLVTAVGGTSLLLDRKNNRVTETGWETSLDFADYSGPAARYESAPPGEFYFGAGGGVSTLFAQPWYQRTVVPSTLARSRAGRAMRAVPDIAADADPYTGYYIGLTEDGAFGISAIGGTSLACPLIAGIQALASQNRRVDIGFANPLLYALPSVAYRDITPGQSLHFASVSGAYLGTFDTGDTQQFARGYDDITGRGTPRGLVLVAAETLAH